MRRPGRDISVISYSASLIKALEAAEILSKEAIEAEVIDLRTLRPLDEAAFLWSVSRTHKALVVDDWSPWPSVWPCAATVASPTTSMTPWPAPRERRSWRRWVWPFSWGRAGHGIRMRGAGGPEPVRRRRPDTAERPFVSTSRRLFIFRRTRTGGVLAIGSIYARCALLRELREKGMQSSLAAVFLCSRAVKLPLLPLMVHYFGAIYTLLLCLYLLGFSFVSGMSMLKFGGAVDA